MEPRYSVLLCNQSIRDYHEQISEWLHSGIKVIWFGESAIELKNEFKPFADAFLIQAFQADFDQKLIVMDGMGCEQIIPVLEKKCPLFNSAQYQVEHCQKDEHIVVQASAGTGKTTVMIDRIMFLMHTVQNLQMSDIYMITFTNEAANQMNMRLQDVLMIRFRLTGQLRYFRWVEEQSQMNISTIHSFAYMMLKEYGIGQSFTRQLAIRSFKYERREIIKDRIDQRVDPDYSVRSQVGLSFYKANTLIDKYWEGFATLGVSRTDMEKMNWGEAANDQSIAFQKLISGMVEGLDEDYFEVKRQNDAISVNDIMRDLQEVLMSDDLPLPDLQMKYLFIDEFQDSDLSQIKVATLLVKLLGARLFVVGDVKQSIYRFRGATDQAFHILDQYLKEVKADRPRNFILINNYRTAANIMERMNHYFECWGRDKLLQYDGPVIPFNRHEGYMRMIPGDIDQETEDRVIVEVARKQLDLLIKTVNESEKPVSPKNRVVMLTRTNAELKKLAGLLRKNKIPAAVNTDGNFYTSEAVRDFYALITSYMYADEPKHIFNYLMSPYAGNLGESLDIHTMEQFGGDYEQLVVYLGHFLEKTSWEKYYKDFRLQPVMSVIKNILDYEPVIETFIENSKRRKLDAGWEEKRIIAATRTEAMQYQANLEKLQELLQRNLGGSKVSLYDIFHFLQLQIATNRSETEPVVETEDDYTSILCMTVHKSKGLEFDTVIIPYTHRMFPSRINTELLVDPLTKEVGWNYNEDKNLTMRNSLYTKLKDQDIIRTREEETRILYVAMTRAINQLICVVHPPKDTERWAYLLEEGGVDYE